jgi:hypothetical protein
MRRIKNLPRSTYPEARSAAATAKNKALAPTRSHRGLAPPPADAKVLADLTVRASRGELWSSDGELIINLHYKSRVK